MMNTKVLVKILIHFLRNQKNIIEQTCKLIEEKKIIIYGYEFIQDGIMLDGLIKIFTNLF